MKIFNVVQIFDNGEFITIVTHTGSAVHLPHGKHSITVEYVNGSNAVATISFGEAE